MDIRSKIGNILHKTCSLHPKTVIKYISYIMETQEPSCSLSIFFIAIFCFSLNYVAYKERKSVILQYKSVFMKHVEFNEDEHMHSISLFMKAGGAENFPCPKEYAEYLLGLLKVHNEYVGKLLSYLVSSHPLIISPLIWNWVNENEKEDKIGVIHLLADICSSGNLLIGQDDLMKRVAADCVELSNKNNKFLVIESSLTLLAWFVKNEIIVPNIPIDYKQPSLVALALVCYAEYIEYGDIEVLPELPHSNDPSIQRAYAQIILSASKNDDLYKLKIDNPIWDIINNEFLHEDEKKSFECTKNILSFSINEMKILVEISHLLPAYFFVHAMRAITKNVDIMRKLIQLVGKTPKPVLVAHIEDFYEFITRTIEAAPYLAECLSDTIKRLIIILRPYLGQLMLRLHPIDFFNSQEVAAKFTLIETILSLSQDAIYFLDDFESLWEILSYEKLSPTYLISVFNFFESIAPLIDMDTELFELGLSPLLPIYNIPLPASFSNRSRNVYNACTEFYSVTSSDIVSDPLFTAKDIYQFTACSLRLISSVKLQENELTKYLFSILDKLIFISPVEATAAAIRYMDIGFSKYPSNMNSIVNAFCLTVDSQASSAFIMQARVFAHKIRKYRDFNITNILEARPIFFNDNIRDTRLAIQSDFELYNLLICKPEHLTVLLEQWNSHTPPEFLTLVRKAAETKKDPEEVRYFREFIDQYGIKQPPMNAPYSWNQRQFIENYVQKPITMPENIEGTTEEIMKEISKYYPIEANDENSLITFIKVNRKNKKLLNIIRKLIEQNVDDLVSKYYRKEWFIRLLLRMKIKFSVKEGSTPLIRGIRIRKREINVKDEELKDWEVPEVTKTLQNKSKNEVEAFISKYKSMTLNLIAWQQYSGHFIQETLPSNAIHSLLAFSKLIYANGCDFKVAFKENIDAINSYLNCTDWRNPPFFWAVIGFMIIVIQEYPSEDIFISKFLDALKVLSKYTTAPIFECLALLPDLFELSHELQIPEEFKTERFKGLEL